jgi:hypothetical protein
MHWAPGSRARHELRYELPTGPSQKRRVYLTANLKRAAERISSAARIPPWASQEFRKETCSIKLAVKRAPRLHINHVSVLRFSLMLA